MGMEHSSQWEATEPEAAPKKSSKAKESQGSQAGTLTNAGIGAATSTIGAVSADLLKRRQEAQALRIKHEADLREAVLKGRVLPAVALQRGEARANDNTLSNLPNIGRR